VKNATGPSPSRLASAMAVPIVSFTKKVPGVQQHRQRSFDGKETLVKNAPDFFSVSASQHDGRTEWSELH
jgi:hypothetical protein